MRIPAGLTIAFVLCNMTRADEPVSGDLFRDRVVPILQHRCLSCHNSLDHKGDFSLQTRDELRDSGFVEPGVPNESALLDALISSDGDRAAMPKNGTPLSEKELAAIREWIASGAEWPDNFRIEEPVVDNFDWWSLQPMQRMPVPQFSANSGDAAWLRNPIDAFVLEEMHTYKLQHSGEADRRTLIRRLTFDLVGLPPTPAEVDRFVNSSDPLAYERLVDRLLDSPHYGERWSRHWLDVVKYADTCGYDKDKLRPNAWPYRDYVIRSMNDDKPYARFVQEQIAGDVLFPETADGILGLGFIAAGPWDFIGHVEVPESKIDGRVARHIDRDEMVSNTLNTFCSVTIQCARCHNHKFDPFTQEHYYSLQSVFAAVDRAERPYGSDPRVERRRRQLDGRLAGLQAEQKSLMDEIRKAGGEELAAIDKQVNELKSKSSLKPKRPEYGYHSQIVSKPDVEKWVQVDLGREIEIKKIIIRPCHDEFAGIGAGFGFPVQFKVTAALRDADFTRSDPVTLDDQTSSDFPNPGLAPYTIETDPIKARFVRLTATKLVERKNDFILAVSELQVFDGKGNNVALNAKVTSIDSIQAPVRWARKNLTDGIWPEAQDESALVELAEAQRQHTALLAKINTPERQARKSRIEKDLAATQNELNGLPKGRMVYAAATTFAPQANFKPTMGKPRVVKVLHRGNIQQPRDEVRPGTVPVIRGTDWHLDLPADHSEGDRRAALARWLTRHDHPLTWRSIVNRIWQYHFGQGIVASPNDFGRMGQQPTHPELLDWLATDFRDNGQSFKKLHRLIVTSSTYRQSSAHNETNAKIDGSNRFLWRMRRRRLEAEEIRDSILSVSGSLNGRMHGSGYYLFSLEKTAHSPHYEYHKFDHTDVDSHRRSVYRFIVRSQPDPFMTTLDCADSSQSTPRRNETLTSLQALSMLNNRFSLLMAAKFASRLEGQDSETADQIVRAFRLAFGRPPASRELHAFMAYAQQHGLANCCRVLFNMSEFVFLD
jgi:hypothetical protein